jgi:hypothetical protein
VKEISQKGLGRRSIHLVRCHLACRQQKLKEPTIPHQQHRLHHANQVLGKKEKRHRKNQREICAREIRWEGKENEE